MVVAAIAVDVAGATRTGPSAPTWAAVAVWLDNHLDDIRRLDTAPAHLKALRMAVAAAEKHVDRPAETAWLGPCGRSVWQVNPACPCTCHVSLGAACDAATGCHPEHLRPCQGAYLAVDGNTEATCTGCRHTVHAETRRRELLDRSLDLWLTAREIEQLTATLGDRVPDSTIASWHRRGQILGSRPWSKETDRAMRAQNPTRYLVADVMARFEARQARTAQPKGAPW